MSKPSIQELLATAKHQIMTVAEELEKNGIDLIAVKIVRDDDGNIERCLMTWGMDVDFS